MKTIIIDGYNVMHKLPEFSQKLKKSLKDARMALAIYIKDWKKRYSNAEVCIVFDGKNIDEFDWPRANLRGINCFFTKEDEGADERIISMVRDSDDPRSIVVISDDNNIRHTCKACGAKVESTSFLHRKCSE